MWKEYIKEREGKSVLETQEGFVIYNIEKDECYIQDIYVKPDFRKSGIASSMADKVAEIARGSGCKWLTGSVAPSANGAHSSLLVLISYGMQLARCSSDAIYFSKRIA